MNIENNLNILTNLKKDDKLFIDNNKLLIKNDDDDDFKLVNSYELCNNIVTTLLFTLHIKCNLVYKDDYLNIVEIILDNIYANKELSTELDNNEFFSQHLRNIEYILEEQINKYKINKCNRFFIRINELFDGFLDLTIHVSRSIVKNNRFITIVSDYNDTESDEEENSDNSEESDENSNNEENSDNEENLKED